jgi:hypothetical protein
MKRLLAALIIALSTSAFADGFICEQTNHNLSIQIFNNTQPAERTRNVAIMILSDENVGYGNKTIASFSASKRTLGQNGTSYFAFVDLRVSESSRAGENLLGTKLENIKEIYVDINFKYSAPLRDGQITDGYITVVKRNGRNTIHDITCTRYLKNF